MFCPAQAATFDLNARRCRRMEGRVFQREQQEEEDLVPTLLMMLEELDRRQRRSDVDEDAGEE